MLPTASRARLGAVLGVGALALLSASTTAGVAPSAAQVAASQSLSISYVARALQPGEVVVARIASPVSLQSARVTGFGRTTDAVRLVSAGEAGEVWQALLGIDVAAEPGTASLQVEAVAVDGSPLTAVRSVAVEEKTFRQRRLTVAPKYVSPPAGVQARIEREAARLQKIYGTLSQDILCTPPFARPVGHRQNSPFGSQSIFNGQVRGRHLGVDFASPAGAPIHAPAPGRVVLTDDLYYTGNTVVIDHGQGVYSILAHLSRITIADGARVATGDPVGHVGSTGRSSGPHLHWSVRIGGARVDPMSLVEVG